VIDVAWLLFALPAAGALVILLAGRRASAWAHWLGVATVVASFVIGLALLFETLGLAPQDRTRDISLFSWISSGTLNIDFGIRLDPLSLTFVLLITGVGSLIHLYSVGYMSHDPGRRRFFAQLNLFVAAMLILVLGNNFVMLYLGWEGVGLASYLLIGFYQDRPSAATAAKKAFLMNRVGDVGLAIAIFLIWLNLGTLQYSEVFARIGEVAPGTVLAITILLLLGACGKSGQFPLQSWLPDAMEGPTPVSALIHAATMVTAGVYLIARTNPIYDLTATGRVVVALIGVVTLLIGAVIGCAYDDIKKVLAYSTVSQIGYMILAVGLGPAGYALGIFHLLTHGFFKAGLFLGAGSVMHGMNDDVDMRHYGALSRAMPVTFLTFSMGYLAIIGFPGFSGFWSKDKIIEAALTQNWFVGVLAMLGAGVTGFYMTRLMFMTFFSQKRWEPDVHPHESPAVMTVPLMVLAALSVFGGLMLVGDWIVDFLEPVTGTPVAESPPIPGLMISLIVVLIVAVGVAIAWYVFQRQEVPREAPQDVSLVTRAARAELYGNEINEVLVVRPGAHLVSGLVTFDRQGVDGVVEGTALGVGGVGSVVRLAQTGFVRTYALSVLVGALVVVAALLAVNLA